MNKNERPEIQKIPKVTKPNPIIRKNDNKTLESHKSKKILKSRNPENQKIRKSEKLVDRKAKTSKNTKSNMTI